MAEISSVCSSPAASVNRLRFLQVLKCHCRLFFVCLFLFVSGTEDPLGPFDQARPDHGICRRGAGERPRVHGGARNKRERGEGTLRVTNEPSGFRAYVSNRLVSLEKAFVFENKKCS